jgi:hypothetical protein
MYRFMRHQGVDSAHSGRFTGNMYTRGFLSFFLFVRTSDFRGLCRSGHPQAPLGGLSGLLQRRFCWGVHCGGCVSMTFLQYRRSGLQDPWLPGCLLAFGRVTFYLLVFVDLTLFWCLCFAFSRVDHGCFVFSK